MKWLSAVRRSCAKGALEKAISTAEAHAERYRDEIAKLTPANAPIGDTYMHVMECHDRMVLRLRRMLEQRFPEPRYRRILK